MKYLYSLCLLFITASLAAQSSTRPINLEHTRWTGKANVPDPETVTFDFGKDTVSLLFEGRMLELMRYRISTDTIYLQKLEGKSPCDTEAAGMYRLSKTETKLSFILLTDDCPMRAEALKGYEYELEKEKKE